MRTLPSFADLDEAAIRPVVERNHEAVLAGLELRRRPRPSDVNDSFVRTGAERARQGVAASDMAAAWRIGQESLYRLASTLVGESPNRDWLLREFLELVMSWVDFAMLGAAEGHRTTELSELRRLMQEQAALRRVATLVASEASRGDVFSAIAEESAHLFGIEDIRLVKFHAGSQVVVASSGRSAELYSVGSRQMLGGENATSIVYRTGEPGRLDMQVTVPAGPPARPCDRWAYGPSWRRRSWSRVGFGGRWSWSRPTSIRCRRTPSPGSPTSRS